MNRMIASFLRQASCGSLAKFAILHLCQQFQRRDEVIYQCCKLWRTINAYKGARLESRVFSGFLNQTYGPEVFEFYFRVPVPSETRYSFESHWSNMCSEIWRNQHDR